jgi:nucleotide-binding universal stress UspA family protein
MTTKMLCATDGSHASEKAVALSITLARQLRVPLSFLTVNLASEDRTSKTHFWDERILGAADAQISQVLGNAASAAKQAGLGEVSCIMASGREVASAIVDYAEHNGYDHIVTGSSGYTGPTRLLLGSVSSQVVAKAHCPVTIAR